MAKSAQASVPGKQRQSENGSKSDERKLGLGDVLKREVSDRFFYLRLFFPLISLTMSTKEAKKTPPTEPTKEPVTLLAFCAKRVRKH